MAVKRQPIAYWRLENRHKGLQNFRGKDNLKLSVEYLVLQHPWRTLFSAEQLQIARERLKQVECEPPPDEN